MLSMYKAGQGYWTRMMTAIFFGVLIAGGALWLSGQVGNINFQPAAWRYTVEGTPSLPVGEVELRRSNEVVGSAVLQRTEGNVLELVNVSMRRDESATNVQTIVAPSGEIARTSSMQTVQRFEKTYLQGGLAAAILFIGAILILWLCYTNKRTSEFLIATEGEMKKVNWSSRREVFGSTWVVIAISVIIATILFVTDLLFQFLSREAGLLQI